MDKSFGARVPISQKHLEAGLRFFIRIAELWGLSKRDQAEILAVRSYSDIASWIEQSQQNQHLKIPFQTIERISLLIGIRRRIELQYPKSRWNIYMRTKNVALKGETPISFMVKGNVECLYLFRNYLDCGLLMAHKERQIN